MEKINTSMNVENILFNLYKDYMKKESKFEPTVLPSSSKSLTKFPTILFKEQNNVDNMQYTTLDRTQKVSDLTLVVEIYTQNKNVGNTKYASKYIMDELKYLTFDFFDVFGCQRMSCEPAEYYNKEVDRLVIIYSCSVNNWNRKIS